jgi:ribose 1,5-bisphosphate isomerase
VHPNLVERVERVRKDDEHGASWLAREALEAVAEAVALGEDHVEVARAMAAARPSIGAIAGAVGRVLAAGRTPEQVAEEAHALVAARERASHAISVLLTPLMKDVVMTHSASATVREALIHTPPKRVVCTVSEPIGEGRRFVEELREAGFTADLVDDPDAPHAVGTVDLLLVGADAVFPDGSLVNKVGTGTLLRGGEEGVFAPGEIAALVDRTPFLREGYRLLAGEAA